MEVGDVRHMDLVGNEGMIESAWSFDALSPVDPTVLLYLESELRTEGIPKTPTGKPVDDVTLRCVPPPGIPTSL